MESLPEGEAPGAWTGNEEPGPEVRSKLVPAGSSCRFLGRLLHFQTHLAEAGRRQVKEKVIVRLGVRK